MGVPQVGSVHKVRSKYTFNLRKINVVESADYFNNTT